MRSILISWGFRTFAFIYCLISVGQPVVAEIRVPFDYFNDLVFDPELRVLWSRIIKQIGNIREWNEQYTPVTRAPDRKYDAWLQTWEERVQDAVPMLDNVRERVDLIPEERLPEELNIAEEVQGKQRVKGDMTDRLLRENDVEDLEYAVHKLDLLDGYMITVPKMVKELMRIVGMVTGSPEGAILAISWLFGLRRDRSAGPGPVMVIWNPGQPAAIKALLRRLKFVFHWAAEEFQKSMSFIRALNPEDQFMKVTVTFESMAVFCNFYSERVGDIVKAIDRIRKTEPFKNLYKLSGSPLPKKRSRNKSPSEATGKAYYKGMSPPPKPKR
ncbi:hypothetical protein ABW19_dt0206198 [Dactylella cylindrospora]|nr:hypothetical protein ABW19_dt0206198 [Dactylella cylindrospora]